MYRAGAAIVILLTIAACGRIRPDAAAGPVIDGSRNVSASRYVPGGLAPNRLAFVRHFHYFSQPASWTIVSSGDSSPWSHFEETAVYVLLFVGEPPVPVVIRIAHVPWVRTDGITPPRVHVAIAAPFQSNNPSSAAIVYIEDGPIYGGFDVGGELDPAKAGKTPLRLLVDARVRVAALARDGVTLAYVDDMGKLYITRSDEPAEASLVDIQATLGPVSINAMQWENRGFGRLIIRAQRGRGFRSEVWHVDTSFTTPRLIRSFVDPETVREPGSDQLPFIDEMTHEIGPGEWEVPVPSQFTSTG